MLLQFQADRQQDCQHEFDLVSKQDSDVVVKYSTEVENAEDTEADERYRDNHQLLLLNLLVFL